MQYRHGLNGMTGLTMNEKALNSKDREKIQNFLSTCIHPFDTENHPAETVNKHTSNYQ